jgi:hypothetical protein
MKEYQLFQPTRSNRVALKTLLTNKKYDPILQVGGSNFFCDKPIKGKVRE